MLGPIPKLLVNFYPIDYFWKVLPPDYLETAGFVSGLFYNLPTGVNLAIPEVDRRVPILRIP
jgi:hypothetical protein